MRIVNTLLISLTAVLHSGCVLVTSYAKLEPQLAQWEQDHNYGRSLDALGQIDPKDPDYGTAATMRKQVEKQAAEYEQQVRKETLQKQQQGDWAAALDQYDEALNRHPKSVVIRDGLAKLHLQQQENLGQLEQQRLIMHGEWLRDVLPVYQEIASVDPRSYQAQNRLKRVIDEAKGISHELTLIGNKALADNDLETAELTLPLAFKLNSAPVIEESLNTLRTMQKQVLAEQRAARRSREQRNRAQREKVERALSAVVKRYDRAMASQDYLTARAQLAAIEELDHRYSKLPAMTRTLQKAIDEKVAQQFSAGVSAYSRGLFEQAAREWRAVLALNPKHQQAKENLERAEKVLERIDALREKQGG